MHYVLPRAAKPTADLLAAKAKARAAAAAAAALQGTARSGTMVYMETCLICREAC